MAKVTLNTLDLRLDTMQKSIDGLDTKVEKFNTQIWYTGTSKNLFQVIENKAFFIDLTTS